MEAVSGGAAFFAGPAGYSSAACDSTKATGALLFIVDDLNGLPQGATQASRHALEIGLSGISRT